MSSKIIKFLGQEITAFRAIILFIGVLVSYAATSVVPLMKWLFPRALDNLITQCDSQFIINTFGNGEKVYSMVAVASIVLHAFIVTFTWVFAIVFLVILTGFRSILRVLCFKKFTLKREATLISDMKLIATWMVISMLTHFLMQIFPLPNFIYRGLSILVQAGVFYLLVRSSCFGCKIKKRSKDIKA
jgi:hypothetical protein